MDLEEARQVVWLNTYPRPLGELFDEGYLTRSRLTWAAEKAYDPRIREAAKVLLGLLPEAPPTARLKEGEAEKPTARAFDPGISLEQARAKPWPFGSHKSEPMGPLVDSRELTLKDLAYAIETARDDSVRRSAMALLLERLDQILKEPPPATGLVEVISGGRSYAKQTETWFTFLQGGLYGLIVGFCIMLLVLSARTLAAPGPAGARLLDIVSTPTGIIAAAVALLLVFIAYWVGLRLPEQLDHRLQKQIDKARLGQEGEDKALQVILQALDGSWKVFRNVEVPGPKHGDLDFVLVGPPGVWVLEVKNWHGKYRNVGEQWEKWDGRLWKEAAERPSEQVQHSAADLGRFLRAEVPNAYAEAAVVWANPESSLAVDNPMLPVWVLDRLPDELGNIWYSRQIPEGTREQIVEKLTRLCERQRRQKTKRAGHKA
jgi:hypothetical protein